MGDFTIGESLRRAFEKSGITYYELRNASPEEFYVAIGNAKQTNPHGPFVTQHEVDEYREMRLFITLDGKAGIAITKDGNIVSVFNGGEKRGVLKTLLPVAIEQGGRKLDNYDSPKLSTMYELYGFNPVTKVRFNDQFSPEDWNYERDGTPDIVFWIHNGDSAVDVVLNFGKHDVSWENVEEFGTYEEAEKRRDKIIEEIDRLEAAEGQG